jgi:AcrR family transcriptional regulator
MQQIAWLLHQLTLCQGWSMAVARTPTRLQRELAGTGNDANRTPTALDAFRLARRRWLDQRRVDMSALALDLGVNRVTLYRWVGSRDELLVEIIWSLALRTLRDIDARTRATGSERAVLVVRRFLDAVIANPAMVRWLADEGELAMRLLTRHDHDFQPRLIAWIEGLLHEEADAGRLEVPADLHEVAYVMVRLIESYTYLDLITGETPDARRAEPILRLLLR